MSDPKQGDFDLDEDLFDFGGVGPEPEPPSEENLEEIFASFRAESASEEAAASVTPAPAPAAAPAPAPVHAEEHAPAARPAPAAPVARSAPSAPAAHAAAHAPAHAQPRAAAHAPEHELVPAPRLTRFSKGLVVIALSVTVLNAGLAVVLLRGRAAPDASHEESTPTAHAAPPEEPAVRPQAHVDPLPDPERVTPSHGHPTLDEAREELARGDHAAARRRVYGLLAIVDRLEDPRKSELEAECQYLIAQSLHLEALARMGAHE